jgi:PEP-CTERM motif
VSLKNAMRVSCAGLAAAALGLFAPPAEAANLVVNGSFESGLLGWAIGGTDLQGFPPVAITYNSATGYPSGAFGEAVPPNNAPTNSPDPVGSQAAYFVTDLANAQSLSQSVFLTPGTYQIGFSAYLPANGFANAGDATFSGEVAGVTLANFAASTGTPQTWQTFMGSTTITTAGNYPVQFIFDTGLVPSKDVVIDQVYVIPGDPPLLTPEPATVALFGTGLLGLTFLRRPRRKA